MDASAAKACAKVRLLELHAARLGIVDIALETKELNDLTTPHGLLSAPELDPKTWKLLRSEVPEGPRESFRFDEFAGRIECVRLGALSPAVRSTFYWRLFYIWSASWIGSTRSRPRSSQARS